MGDPLPISVIIPAYDRERMVVRAVRSALAQTPRAPAEVIVVDDCSSDATGTAAADAGARVIRHDVNRGEGAARNTGVAAATQPWIGLLDSDDEWLPHLLATLWPLREDHVLAAGASFNRGEDRAHDRYAGPTGRRPLTLRSPAALLYPENFVPASGTIARADVVRAVGGYDTKLRHGADLDLWIRVLERGTGAAVPEVVVVYHMHPGQVTRDHEAMAAGQLRVLRSYSDRPWWSAARVEGWRGVSAWDGLRRELRAGRRAEAARRAAFIIARPERLAGVAGIFVRRHRLRRRTAELAAALGSG